ncbi:MAG: regulatory protein RecX [Bacteroidota bacterium]|nr:regulatory protein RecX [Bacteroidota bacterium]
MIDFNKALAKMMDACSRAEKCTRDIRDKLRKWELPESQIATIIEQLKEQKFIDDNRYAKAFVRDKSQFNRWGKTKIRYHLQAKGIPAEAIVIALQEIEEDKYQEQLEHILRNKIRGMVPIEDYYQAKAKLIRFAASRGFEAELVYAAVDRLLKEMSD